MWNDLDIKRGINEPPEKKTRFICYKRRDGRKTNFEARKDKQNLVWLKTSNEKRGINQVLATCFVAKGNGDV